MEGKIIMCVISLMCAALFFSIGSYAKKSHKPMGFWSGSKVDASRISDIKKYNNANGIMWQLYSLFYFGSAFSAFLSPIISAILLIMDCTLGFVFLIVGYNKICGKYMIH